MKLIIVCTANVLLAGVFTQSMSPRNQPQPFSFKNFFETLDERGKTYAHYIIKSCDKARWKDGTFSDEIPDPKYLKNILATNSDIVASIIKSGIDVNVQDSKGQSLVFYAVKYKNVEALRLLLEAHANPNIKNKKNESPLFQALGEENNEPIITLLLQKGADTKELFQPAPDNVEKQRDDQPLIELALTSCLVNAAALLKYFADNGFIVPRQ